MDFLWVCYRKVPEWKDFIKKYRNGSICIQFTIKKYRNDIEKYRNKKIFVGRTGMTGISFCRFSIEKNRNERIPFSNHTGMNAFPFVFLQKSTGMKGCSSNVPE
jgi:hypothetical protein